MYSEAAAVAPDTEAMVEENECISPNVSTLSEAIFPTRLLNGLFSPYVPVKPIQVLRVVTNLSNCGLPE